MSTAKLLNNLLFSARNYIIFSHHLRFNNTAATTLKVAERIKVKREEALLGGGQKRIDQQHKKVGMKVSNGIKRSPSH